MNFTVILLPWQPQRKVYLANLKEHTGVEMSPMEQRQKVLVFFIKIYKMLVYRPECFLQFVEREKIIF